MLKKSFYVFLPIFIVFFCTYVRAVNDSDILEAEPIDIVYKYIDLNDKALKRKNIEKISKDYDNEELRYSLRSVLKNIPWVRNIFILMPNDEVKFLKPVKQINEKIKYVKDADFLGFDSASSITFEFNLCNMAEFGCSTNFIYLNDDYFIGKPMSKSDFFYVENGKVVPYVFYPNNLEYGQRNKIRNFHHMLYGCINRKGAHSAIGFSYQKISSFLFLYDYFNRDILAPNNNLWYFPHNAFGINLKEAEEVRDIVRDHYRFPDDCLKAIYRTNDALQFNTVYSFYILNKYDRKQKNPRHAYIDLSDATSSSFNYQLFCINKGGDKNYSANNCIIAKYIMNKLFPVKTEYELPVLEDGIYEIISSLDGNKVLDIAGGSPNSKANLHLWERNGTLAQRFEIKEVGNGYYTIKPKCSKSTLLDVQRAGQANGSNIWQYKANSTDAQKWSIVSTCDGWYNIISKCNGLCVDISGANTQNGTNAQCWNCNGTNAQKFKFRKIS